jgi:ATP-dependent Clp protease ATP-binding subunit ClpA
MPTPPFPLESLVAYVQRVHADGGPLAHLVDAVDVAARLNEDADALVGHFVDQARDAGQSWSQIGASMAISKQAAQQRFADHQQAGRRFTLSRVTELARHVIAAAGQLAELTGVARVGDDHLALGLLSESNSLAARIIHASDIADGDLAARLGLPLPAPEPTRDASVDALHRLRFDRNGRAALEAAFHAALRLGHDDVDTEHLLLGVLSVDRAAARALKASGLTIAGTAAALAKARAQP